MKDIEDRALTRHGFHGEWNYTVLPVPRPAPDRTRTRPPARPGRCRPGRLNHPALTGLDPRGPDALAAAWRSRSAPAASSAATSGKDAPASAPRAPAGGGSNRKLDLPGHVLALRLRQHLNLPGHVIGALLGADKTTISHATTLTDRLLAARSQHPPAAPPPATRLRTLDDLREYAAATASPSPPRSQPPLPRMTR